MGANLNKVFVIDVEATCWTSEAEQAGRPNEIIEIGICTYNPMTKEIGNGRSYVVKPQFTEVSPFCTALTGWTQEQVDQGYPIGEVIQRIGAEYSMTSNHVWFSCGEYDRIKTLFAMKYGMKKEMGMARMITHINETLEGRHHNGLDDALNIAKIVKHVLS